MPEDRKPPRVIGLGGAVLINLNSVIGAGIFALPALLYASAGSFAPVAIIVFAGLYSCLVAIAAKLSTVFSQSGGPQLYAEHAFGPLAGFLVGWFLLIANMGSRAANLHVLVAYLAAIFPVFDEPLMRSAALLFFLIAFMSTCIAGTRLSILAMGGTTAIKLVPLLALCIGGFAVNGWPTEVVLPQFSEIESVALLLAYAFSGATTVTAAAGESRDPGRTVMRSIFLNMVVVALIYSTIQLAYIAIGPDPAETQSPLAAAGNTLFGPLGGLAISIAAIFSIVSNQLSNFVAVPRIAYGMARRGLLPNFFTYVSPRFETPAAAIAVYSCFIAALALSGTFELLVKLVISVEQVMFVSLVGSLMVMWRRNDGGIANDMGPGWALVILVALALIVWLCAQLPITAALSTLLLMGIGVAAYLWSRRSAVVHETIAIPEATDRQID